MIDGELQMKQYLINPNLNWYKANMHCHTTNSDGRMTPEEIKKVYQEHGYSVVAFTDHEVIIDNSYLSDDKFLALTSTEYSINLPSENGFRDVKTIHMNLFSKDPHIKMHPAANSEMFGDRYKDIFNGPVPADGYHRVYTQESIQETINRANKAGFLVQFNHPNWSLNTREDYINLKGLWALEIYNYLTDLETGAEYCPNIYDDLLRHGHRLCCTMGDDNHNYQKSVVGSFGGFVYIGAEKLAYDDIFNALKNGVFYSSMGPVIEELSLDKEAKKVYIRCSEVEDIIFVGYNRRFVNFHGENLKEATFDLQDRDIYFRIAIRDKFGKFANTNAYFLDEID